MAEQANTFTEVTVTLNLPAYNSNVQIWFAQLGAIFNVKRINFQSFRYAYIVEKFPPGLPQKFRIS